MELIHKNRLIRLAAILSRRECTICHDSDLYRKCHNILVNDIAGKDGVELYSTDRKDLIYYSSPLGRNDPRHAKCWEYLGLTQRQYDHMFLSTSYYASGWMFKQDRKANWNAGVIHIQAQAVSRILNFIVDEDIIVEPGQA